MGNTYNMLVKKSIEAFLLGLEIYNKPTIHYRVEGFSFFICNSWELMLKAKLIKENGEKSIYFKDNPSRTVSLEYCVKEIFTNKHDPLRLNIEKIIELRNVSTHFITEDYEVIYAPLFQSSVFNYMEKMSLFHDVDITEYVTQSFLSLVIKEDDLDPAIIKSKYSPETAEKLLTTKREIEMIEKENSPAFSIDIRHNFYITKKVSDAESTVRIAKDGEIPVQIIKEQKDPNKTHSYTQKNCVKEINKILSREKITFEHTSIYNKIVRKTFNTADFQLFLKFYDLKNQERYCYCHVLGTNKQYTYSRAIVDFIITEIKKNPKKIIDHLKMKTKK